MGGELYGGQDPLALGPDWWCVSCGFPADLEIEDKPYCLSCWDRDNDNDGDDA